MNIRRLATLGLSVAIVAFAVFWWLSAPVVSQSEESAQGSSPDLVNGEKVFWASGCASCHAAEDAKNDEKLLLGGGHRLETPFGVFVTPNISPDPDTGIGNWSETQFVNAMVSGVAPGGSHYYPSFPYASYNKTMPSDLSDLLAFLKTLPSVSRANEPHELALPFQWRRPLGIWKRMFADDRWVTQIDETDAELVRGRYLVEALGHCAECHTPRNFLGGLERDKWMAGGPAPEGEGKIPNITPHSDGIGNWSVGDIAYYLESGFTPEFDSVGGTMVSVQRNMAKLPKSDLTAIAKYLKSIPPVPAN